MTSRSGEARPPPPVVTIVVFTATLFPLLISIFQPKLTPVIKISDGLIQGRVAYSRNGTEYWEFLSIPYAQPPLKKLRFQPPLPAKPWDDLKLTTNYPPDCAQFESVVTKWLLGNEDCLFINVMAPPNINLKNEANASRLPVLVNIPGGGFFALGAMYYGPNYFMDAQDIIIVTFNYRLGPLGFLNFAQSKEDYKDFELPRGNMGIKDQLLALQWVQKNIGFFGGDPNRVTLYGQSAGAISAQLHMISSNSQGLFQRVFSQSGTMLGVWTRTTRPRQLAINLAKKVGCPLDRKRELLECLQMVDPYKLAFHQRCVVDPTVEQDIFVPSIETIVTEDTFLSQHPYELLLRNAENFQDIPLIIGANLLRANTGEGAFRLGVFESSPKYIREVEENWSNVAGVLCGFNNFPKNRSEDLRNFYFPGITSFTKHPQLFMDQLANLCGDLNVYEGTHTLAYIHSRRNESAPLYLFWYDYRPTGIPGIFSLYKAVGPSDWLHSYLKIIYTSIVDFISEHVLKLGKGSHQYGAAHSEEIYLLWVIDPITKWTLSLSKPDVQFSEAFVKVILDFAKGKDKIMFRGVPWPQVSIGIDPSKRPFSYMMLDQNGLGKVIPEPFTGRLHFWKSIGIRNFS